MKKILLFMVVVISIFGLIGCGGKASPTLKVEYMLNKYITNDENVMSELESYLDKQDLNKEQIERYKSIIKNEYSTMRYIIKSENIKDDKAYVEVEISVIDLYKPSKEATNYLNQFPTEFYVDGKYDQDKFIDYKLYMMEISKDTVNYDIKFSLTKKDNVWILDDLSDDILEKIHGIYDYEHENA